MGVQIVLLLEFGVDISAGQVNALLLEKNESFHEEKDAVLAAGLESSPYVTVDDTGARHKGKAAYVTHIGGQYFSYFQTGPTKSRENFLEILRAGETNYRVNADALVYMEKQGMSPVLLHSLRDHGSTDFADKKAWLAHMDAIGIMTPRYRKAATEGALIGSLSGLRIATSIAIVSDDAGQFNVFTHALCWIHAERLVHKLQLLNKNNRDDIARVRGQIWDFYFALKSYKANPVKNMKARLRKRFDKIFTQWTSFSTLNLLLGRLHDNKEELLLVLDRPGIPLHTNDSERDIRGHVQKQKISGGTRSDLGRQCRDTFSSLKKTCRRLGISYWDYMIDRISCSNNIPSLHEIVTQRYAPP